MLTICKSMRGRTHSLSATREKGFEKCCTANVNICNVASVLLNAVITC